MQRERNGRKRERDQSRRIAAGKQWRRKRKSRQRSDRTVLRKEECQP